MNLLNNRWSGASRLEVAFITLILVTVGLLAYTKYTEVSIEAKGSVEGGLIEVVRSGISDYAYESRKSGAARIFPPFLDEADLGKSASNNLFFTMVMGKRIVVGSGIAVKGWSKTAGNEYVAPSGKRYIYDPQTGVFDVAAADKKK